MAVTVSHQGYIKRNALTQYRSQRRGGKGVTGMRAKEEDFVEHLFVASTHAYFLFFSNRGRLYWKKVHEIPEAGRAARGKAIVNLLSLEQGERITEVLPIKEFTKGQFIVMASENGFIKKTDLMAFSNPRSAGIIALTLDEGDTLISAGLTDGNSEIFLSSKKGKAIRFKETDVRPMGRSARGVRGISLKNDDVAVGMEILAQNKTMLTASQQGFGKRTELDAYPIQKRGGQGVITMKTSERNGDVVGICQVGPNDEVMIITTGGQIIRLPIKDVSVIGRSTQGVRLIRLNTKDQERVASIALLADQPLLPANSASSEK